LSGSGTTGKNASIVPAAVAVACGGGGIFAPVPVVPLALTPLGYPLGSLRDEGFS